MSQEYPEILLFCYIYHTAVSNTNSNTVDLLVKPGKACPLKSLKFQWKHVSQRVHPSRIKCILHTDIHLFLMYACMCSLLHIV